MSSTHEEPALVLRTQAMLPLRGVRPQAVDSLVFRKGELVALLGSVGAGKTSLLRSMDSRKNDNLSGTACILRSGKTVTLSPAYQIRSSRSVFDYLLHKPGEYLDGLCSFLRRSRYSKSIVQQCLERTGLLHRAWVPVSSLGSHELPRLSLAEAILSGPAVILADEPLAGLSMASADAMLALFCRICKEEMMTIIVSLHQVGLAVQYADRIIGLVDGRVFFDDDPSRLTEDTCRDLFAYGHSHCRSYGHCLRVWQSRRSASGTDDNCC